MNDSCNIQLDDLDPEFDSIGWNPTQNAVLENLSFGAIRHRVVRAQDNRILYDFPHYVSQGGVAILPVDNAGCVALLRQDRVAILKRGVESKFPKDVPGDYGRRVWEAPRGFRCSNEELIETAARELLEEIGTRALNITCVGTVYTDSAISSNNVQLFVCDIGDQTPRISNDQKEGLVDVKLFTPNELRNLIDAGEIQCCITLSLVFHGNLRQLINTYGRRPNN